ncbi:hypothetical protein NKDENANG_02264 [Candidatus Entotheonellaceae bacterium PAL068K]
MFAGVFSRFAADYLLRNGISVLRKADPELVRLRQAGLSRLPIGLESGDDQVLRDAVKGAKSTDIMVVGQRSRAAGLELALSVMLGLGGTDRWQAHIEASANVLNAVNPEYIRLRTLAYDPQAPIVSRLEARAGDYRLTLPQGRRDMQTPLGILYEIHTLLTQLNSATGEILADHTSTYINDFAGKLPEDRDRLLQQVEARITDVETGRVQLPCVKAYT